MLLAPSRRRCSFWYVLASPSSTLAVSLMSSFVTHACASTYSGLTWTLNVCVQLYTMSSRLSSPLPSSIFPLPSSDYLSLVGRRGGPLRTPHIEPHLLLLCLFPVPGEVLFSCGHEEAPRVGGRGKRVLAQGFKPPRSESERRQAHAD